MSLVYKYNAHEPCTVSLSTLWPDPSYNSAALLVGLLPGAFCQAANCPSLSQVSCSPVAVFSQWPALGSSCSPTKTATWDRR
jgi:hypothetical protein